MLHYLYNFCYGGYDNKLGHVAPIVLDVRVFAIADKYLIGPLKELAVQKFTQRAEAEWESDDFVAAVTEVYTIIPEHDDALHRVVIVVVKEHAAALFAESRGGNFEKAMREANGLGHDIAKALAALKEEPGFKKYRCPSCDLNFAVSGAQCSTFACPRGCCGQYSPLWWARYRT